MQEEISLREILETIWNGKIIIISVTIAAMILAAGYSFFIVDPTYQAVSTVRVGSSASDSNSQKEMLNSFAEAIKSDASINRIMDKLALDRSSNSINSIRKNIKVEAVPDTSIIRITVEGTDPQKITSISNLIVYELGARIEITDRSMEIVNLRNSIKKLANDITINETELTETQEQLANTPQKLVTQQSLANAPYLQSVVEESGNVNGRDAGAISFTNEEVNPLYLDLQSSVSHLTIALTKQNEQKSIMEAAIDEHQNMINELENQMDEARLSSLNADRMLDGFSAVFISPAIEPSTPIGPNKLLNIAIAAVVGIMLSMMIVFIRHYWQTSSPVAAANQQTAV